MLAGLDNDSSSILVSTDMPYPKLNNEDDVGIVIPKSLQQKWHLIRQPDRRGIIQAITKINRPVDICHYDSDKSYYGRTYGYPLLWRSLKAGGIFISDDIQLLVELKFTQLSAFAQWWGIFFSYYCVPVLHLSAVVKRWLLGIVRLHRTTAVGLVW